MEIINFKVLFIIEVGVLCKMVDCYQIIGVFVDGLLVFDNVIDFEVVQIKKIDLLVVGCVNVLVVFDLEVGNMFVKSLLFLVGVDVVGIVLGVCVLIILISCVDMVMIWFVFCVVVVLVVKVCCESGKVIGQGEVMIDVIFVFNVGLLSIKFCVFDIGGNEFVLLMCGQIEGLYMVLSFVVVDVQGIWIGEKKWDLGIVFGYQGGFDYIGEFLCGYCEGMWLIVVGYCVVYGGLEFV